jgi:hypothetical protein
MMTEAALMSYNQVWASKMVRHNEDRSVSVPVGLWGSSFDPTHNVPTRAPTLTASNSAAGSAGSAEMDTAAQAVGSTSSTSSALAGSDPAAVSDEHNSAIPFTSFLRLPYKVGNGEYRRVLGARVAAALTLQNCLADESLTKTRMDGMGIEAYENVVISFERSRKASFARAEKEKRARLDYLQTVNLATAADVTKTAKISNELAPVTATGSAAPAPGSEQASNMTAEETSDKLAMLHALQEARGEEALRANTNINGNSSVREGSDSNGCREEVGKMEEVA